MTRKSETASEYPASLEIAILSAIKHQMISNGVIRVEELHFAVPLPDEGDYTTEMEGNLLSEGRTEEMEYVRKMGVCEVVDEKDCCDNVCKPLKLKWVDMMKGEKCRSRLVCREMNRARARDEQLGPEDVFSPMPPSEGLKCLFLE